MAKLTQGVDGLQVLSLTRVEIIHLMKTLAEQLDGTGYSADDIPEDIPFFHLENESRDNIAIILGRELTQFEEWCARFDVACRYKNWYQGAYISGDRLIMYTTSVKKAERELDYMQEFPEWRKYVTLQKRSKVIPL